jgi:hypothetical protein
MASQSHRMCVAHSSFSRHLSHMGLFVNPILKRCPVRWQCPVSSPVTHLNWFLFSLNSSLVLLTEGPCRNPFACLSPGMDSHYFLWSLSSPWDIERKSWMDVLACPPKARIVREMPVARLRHSKHHGSIATVTHATTEELLLAVFSVGSVQRLEPIGATERRQPARTGAVEPRSWWTYGAGSQYQVTTSEDTVHWGDLVRAAVIVVCVCVCELATALKGIVHSYTL